MITYEKALLRDIPELVRMRIEFILKINNQTEAPFEFEKELFDYFNENMKNDTFVGWLAYDDKALVGTSGICFYALPPSFSNLTGKTAYIMNMYTIEEYRRQGIASVMFTKLLEEAQSRGHKKIYLHATEEGRPVYKKYGFKDTDNEMACNV